MRVGRCGVRGGCGGVRPTLPTADPSLGFFSLSAMKGSTREREFCEMYTGESSEAHARLAGMAQPRRDACRDACRDAGTQAGTLTAHATAQHAPPPRTRRVDPG